VTPVDYRQSGGRGPFRVHATDTAGNYVTLTYFNNPGWAKKQLPLGEPKLVSGRLDRYGQELQIVHPDYVLEPAEAASAGGRAGLCALRRPHQQRMGQLAGQALARVPELGEWIEPSVLQSKGWQGWKPSLHKGHKDRFADARARTACL
jgi:ATP-dependent DNA helicase RecG